MLRTKEEKNEIPRRSYPHHATITIKIDIRQIRKDGSFHEQVVGNKLLKKYGMSNKAQICFSASTEADCIKLVKEKLERLNG